MTEPSSHLTRRRFLSRGAAGSLAALAGCAAGPAPGERRLRVVVAGVRAQGRRHLAALLRDGRVDIAGLADPDSAVLMQAAALTRRYGAAPEVVQDPRVFFGRSDIDAVTIATPDHWHAFLAIQACEAGHHVFVETPAAHSIEEGEAMVAAAQRHRRLVQVALRARTCPAVRHGMAFVHSGGIGRVRGVRCVCYERRRSIGRLEGEFEVPAHLDFDLWRGPSPRVPLQRRRLHGDWRFDWRTGSGELGEAGSELLDLARWALSAGPAPEWPTRVFTCGARVGLRDDGQTPNTLVAILDFAGVPVVFDQRNLPAGYDSQGRMDRYAGLGYGVVVEGEGRYLVVEPERAACLVFDDRRQLVQQFSGAGDPLVEFLQAVRGAGELSAPIGIGRAASDLAQLLVACHRTAAPAVRVEALRRAMPERLSVIEVDAFDGHVGRNGFDLDHEQPAVSGWQDIDPVDGQFRDVLEANALRRRAYPAPFALGDQGQRPKLG